MKRGRKRRNFIPDAWGGGVFFDRKIQKLLTKKRAEKPALWVVQCFDAVLNFVDFSRQGGVLSGPPGKEACKCLPLDKRRFGCKCGWEDFDTYHEWLVMPWSWLRFRKFYDQDRCFVAELLQAVSEYHDRARRNAKHDMIASLSRVISYEWMGDDVTGELVWEYLTLSEIAEKAGVSLETLSRRTLPILMKKRGVVWKHWKDALDGFTKIHSDMRRGHSLTPRSYEMACAIANPEFPKPDLSLTGLILRAPGKPSAKSKAPRKKRAVRKRK